MLLGLQQYLNFVRAPFPQEGGAQVVSYASGATTVGYGYFGGVLSPVQNRIYFVPYSQLGTDPNGWHYLDCSTGSVVSYASGATTVSGAYMGGVLSPLQNRIYFVPRSQLGTDPNGWHYVSGGDGRVAFSLMAGALFNKL